MLSNVKRWDETRQKFFSLSNKPINSQHFSVSFFSFLKAIAIRGAIWHGQLHLAKHNRKKRMNESRCTTYDLKRMNYFSAVSIWTELRAAFLKEENITSPLLLKYHSNHKLEVCTSLPPLML